MRFKTWPVAALGLGSLLVLVVVSMLTLSRKAQDIYAGLAELNTHHHNVDVKLRRLRSDVNLSGIFVRDYLLDVAREHAPEYRERISAFRRTNLATVAELRSLDPKHGDRIARLETQLDEYWRTFEPLFDWTAQEKIYRSASFLRQEVVPRREAVLAIAQEIEELNNENLDAQRAEVTRRQEGFRAELNRLLWQTGLLGVVVALVAVYRLRTLERRSEEQRAAAEAAEHQMRQLSHSVVAAQEGERKNLSRELHDHVAQVLTALRMELGRIDRARPPSDTRLAPALAEARRLVDQLFRTVRDLSLGLRPSMLDDFGLQPALEWHVRDVSRRFGVDIELSMSGDFDALPEQHRTCVYRAIQEGLTNCVRHANASRICVSVVGRDARVEASIVDDGVGLDMARRRDGLGLRGIEERVKELDGTMTISPAVGRGTVLSISVPLPASDSEGARARVAG
ncbi:MAG TPA: sensor histidine kinase [Vicinamibacterales bacterium]|nr:sensor histidine kinase [Vicinamibacterales bacterium]